MDDNKGSKRLDASKNDVTVDILKDKAKAALTNTLKNLLETILPYVLGFIGAFLVSLLFLFILFRLGIIEFNMLVVFCLTVLIMYGYYRLAQSNRVSQARQAENIKVQMKSVVYSLQHALNGLEDYFSLPITGRKGFIDIIWCTLNGVLLFKTLFARLPGSENLSDEVLIELREILQSNLKDVADNVIFAEGLVNLPLAVALIRSSKTALGPKLEILVIPNVDERSREVIRQLLDEDVSKALIGSIKERECLTRGDLRD
jgi:hypothetical protein